MNVREHEMLRAKKSYFIGVAGVSSLGVVLLFWATMQAIGFAVNPLSVFNVYGALFLGLVGIWIPAIRGYRSASLLEQRGGWEA